ncbi:MAG: LPS export ABC transporter ATP-binding protein [Candidatus Manganitrophus sp.]|nr:LPS export ABC transporter ATP-binding protein [Candidatus Manganitrophus morganii]MDC4204152.1 LPS export ABC transporter ATP-binding protein [Candidatus Manganitrophus sp.]MCG3115644.1 LPS export ABC transporter ATP-binding protein [Candidatus Manganitrophus morganii]MDC4223367.1 LPS export ABC transporter ATP-binding protein [Candidatus Manganitrophus sp.]WDT71555.1 MAG: LPS export ABC transporter ATP-binding protein [Candidatus Manganitrophus sp.]
MLEATELEKKYQGRKVVRNVNIRVGAGEIVGLLGPNGAGKTTTFYMIVGLTPPDRGDIFLNGERMTGMPMYLRARKGISYLPQEPSIFRKLTVEENIMAILETLDLSPAERQSRLEALLGELNISHLAKHKAFTLSGGERRRLEITRALVISPQFILLDEPFAGIDPIVVMEIQKIIFQLKKRGIGVLITDHNVQETLEITDRSYIIYEGEILISGTSSEIANSPQAREIYLGDRFRWQDRNAPSLQS